MSYPCLRLFLACKLSFFLAGWQFIVRQVLVLFSGSELSLVFAFLYSFDEWKLLMCLQNLYWICLILILFRRLKLYFVKLWRCNFCSCVLSDLFHDKIFTYSFLKYFDVHYDNVQNIHTKNYILSEMNHLTLLLFLKSKHMTIK